MERWSQKEGRANEERRKKESFTGKPIAEDDGGEVAVLRPGSVVDVVTKGISGQVQQSGGEERREVEL